MVQELTFDIFYNNYFIQNFLVVRLISYKSGEITVVDGTSPVSRSNTWIFFLLLFYELNFYRLPSKGKYRFIRTPTGCIPFLIANRIGYYSKTTIQLDILRSIFTLFVKHHMRKECTTSP